MRKKITFVFVLLLLAAVLSACASSSSTAAKRSSGNTTQNAAASDTSSSANLLGAGILNLEDTALAVTPQQAKDLLFLWKAVKALGSSSNTAQDETAALYQQIEEAMSAEQAGAIREMSLSEGEISALKLQYGVQDSSEDSSSGGGQNMGEFRGDGPPGGFGGDQQRNQTNRASTASQSSSSSSQDLNALFADALIELLQQRAGQ